MDFSRFKTPDWLIVGGAAVFFIGGFLDWISIEFQGISDSGNNVFDYFLTGIVPWILIVGAGVLTVLLRTGTLKAGTTPWPMIIALAVLLGAVLVTLRFLFPGMGEDIPDEVDVGRGVGLVLCFLAGVVAAVGGVMNFTAGGGTMKDLTDPNKLRRAFDRPSGGSTPPPPPPGGGQMPPPPPPAG